MEAHEKGLDATRRWLLRTGEDNDLPSETHIRNYVEGAIKAYLSASNQVLVPREPTEEMMFHSFVAGFIRIGAKDDEALNLARSKLDMDGQREFCFAQYKAMIAATPNPFKDK